MDIGRCEVLGSAGFRARLAGPGRHPAPNTSACAFSEGQGKGLGKAEGRV